MKHEIIEFLIAVLGYTLIWIATNIGRKGNYVKPTSLNCVIQLVLICAGVYIIQHYGS